MLPQHIKYLRFIVLFRYLPESIIKVLWVASTWQVHFLQVFGRYMRLYIPGKYLRCRYLAGTY